MVSLKETLFSGYIAEGPKAAKFRQIVADFIGNPLTVLTNSCTTALTLAYRLAGVGSGDEVVSTPLTCVASNQPILSLGAKPVWADVDPKTGMITAETIAPGLSEKTKAILVLHKEGDPARLSEIVALAKAHNVKVVEDAAHAFGAKYQGKNIGTIGDYTCFSFQAIKHITTGDGGAIACKDEEAHLRARKLKWFGADRDARAGSNPWEQDVAEWGYKGNINDIAAAIGIEQMKHVHEILAKFNANGKCYSELLQGVPGIRLIERDSRDFSTYWAYCLLAEDRPGLIRKLVEHGVAAGQIHPRNDTYSIFTASRQHLPNVDYFAEREVSLPCGWWVSEEELARICDVIKSGW